jgi:hypothetical protein
MGLRVFVSRRCIIYLAHKLDKVDRKIPVCKFQHDIQRFKPSRPDQINDHFQRRKTFISFAVARSTCSCSILSIIPTEKAGRNDMFQSSFLRMLSFSAKHLDQAITTPTTLMSYVFPPHLLFGAIGSVFLSTPHKELRFELCFLIIQTGYNVNQYSLQNSK